ncbi:MULTISPECIES: VOC family protein [Sporosarcina]|uniref:VOC family protein n=1 Tax=Sporosarcina contaminans TaxID=633403 RepID=A0ABW3TYV0_9BACL
MGEIVKKIETIYLPVNNPKASAKWYEEHLQLKTMGPIEEDADQAQLVLNSGQSIFLIKSKNAVNANFTEINGTEQCSITLEVNNFQRLYEALKANGATITEIVDNDDCGKNFYVYDMDGNKIDIWSGWPPVS